MRIGISITLIVKITLKFANEKNVRINILKKSVIIDIFSFYSYLKKIHVLFLNNRLLIDAFSADDLKRKIHLFSFSRVSSDVERNTA